MSASSPPLPGRRWARLRRDIQSVLRRGAWYVVRSFGSSEVVPEVENAPVRVPADDVELSETPPSRWTIVPRPREAANLPESWGFFYVVCPNCAARAPVGDRKSTRLNSSHMSISYAVFCLKKKKKKKIIQNTNINETLRTQKNI